MTEEKLKLLGVLVSKVVNETMDSGLTWDESVAALGISSKALADSAWRKGDGTQEDCRCHAFNRLTQGFGQDVVLNGSFIDPAIYKDAPTSTVELMLSSRNIKFAIKH